MKRKKNELSDYQICFIEDINGIYTHNHFFYSDDVVNEIKKEISGISLSHIKSYSKTETKGKKYTSTELDAKFPNVASGYEFIDVNNSIKYEKIGTNDWMYFYFGD